MHLTEIACGCSVAFGSAQCPTSADQCSFKVGKVGTNGALATNGFKTSGCDTTGGCCIQANKTSLQVSFQWKNPDFLFSRILISLKNVDFIYDKTDGFLRPEYCELQYKCQLVLDFSIENAEIMENCP